MIVLPINIQEPAKQALALLFHYPVTNIMYMSKKLNKSYNAISNLVQQFVDAGIVVETTQQKRNKLYEFKPYLELLQKEY